MSPTARPFLKDATKRLELWLLDNNTQDIADIYAMECAADNLKTSNARRNAHPRNKCFYCGQYGKYQTACEYCGAPIG